MQSSAACPNPPLHLKLAQKGSDRPGVKVVADEVGWFRTEHLQTKVASERCRGSNGSYGDDKKVIWDYFRCLITKRGPVHKASPLSCELM